MIQELHCLRCNHVWIPRKENPVICPNPACHSPYWNRPYPNEIGKIGEKLIYDLLPGAIWLNELKESGYPWDIEWNNIKIDVKTSGETRFKNNLYFEFESAVNDDRHIFVFVGLAKNKNYIWVIKDASTKQMLISDADNEELVPKLITDEYKRINKGK